MYNSFFLNHRDDATLASACDDKAVAEVRISMGLGFFFFFLYCFHNLICLEHNKNEKKTT